MISSLQIEPVVRAALLEDFGRGGDITSEATIPATTRAKAAIVARERGVVAGLEVARAAFTLVEPGLEFSPLVADGAAVEAGMEIARVTGEARAILTAERTALNFISHLSGIASATSQIAQEIAHTSTQVCCTRKTTPGLRALEKYAVRAGGGINHRFGLDDAVLIKDNHIAVAGGVKPALEAARSRAGHLVKIEIEVDTLAQLREVMEVGADAVLLDNMDPATLRAAVDLVAGRAITEASGRISTGQARVIAECGVDLISSGWITHSAPILDIGLDVAVTGARQ